METSLGKEATKEMLPMQMGDVKRTWANVDGLINDYNYKPNTSLSLGIQEFINWFKKFYIEK